MNFVNGALIAGALGIVAYIDTKEMIKNKTIVNLAYLALGLITGLLLRYGM